MKTAEGALFPTQRHGRRLAQLPRDEWRFAFRRLHQLRQHRRPDHGARSVGRPRLGAGAPVEESLGQARIQVDVTRDQVRAAVTSAWTQYIAAQQQVTANRALVAAAQLALNGVIESNVGQRTTLDVLNAQADVISAQINLASERDVVVASYATLSATGQLSVEKLELAVEKYRPEEHYNAVKDKWFGLRTPDGR